MPSTTANDEYVRKLCNFVRTNDTKLSQSAIQRRRRGRVDPEPNAFSFFSWFTPTPQRILFSIDSDRLHNLLLRFEEIKLDVGPTDIKPITPLTRPLFNEVIKDRSETSSIASFRSSLSAISKLSLPVSALFYQQAPIERELKFLYSSFTRLPSISIHASPTTRSHVEHDPYCVPLEVFKLIESLELVDIDPKRVIGWDRLANSLRIFSMRRCAIEDINDIFVDSVIKDSTRRREQARHQTDAIPEDAESTDAETETQLQPYAWSTLLSLAIPQTGLTFIPNLPALPSLTHLDLSSNLLISIPSSLASLSSLVRLNLSDNMIDSTLNVNSCVGAITFLDLSKNRLESCAGLEKLLALEKIDLRENQLEEADEVGRLSVIPTLREVLAEGNLLEEDWRIRCFNRFYQDGVEIILDGSGPSILERRYITGQTAVQNADSSVHNDTVPKSPMPIAVSPKVNPSKPSPKPSPVVGPTHSSPGHKPSSPPQIKHKKRARRVIDLGSDATGSELQSVISSRRASKPPRIEIIDRSDVPSSTQTPASPRRQSPPPAVRRVSSRGHARHATDYAHMRTFNNTSEGDTNSAPFNFDSVRSKRSLRVSASLHEPSSPDRNRDALDFRARMQALRDQTGDEWLRVLAQREAVASP